MSRLRIFADGDPGNPRSTHHEHAAIAAELARIGVRFERWTASQPVAPGAAPEAVMAAYRTDIDRLTVRALVDGEVLQLNVRPGEYVGTTPGQAFIVLGNVEKLHVRASIDEYDIPRFKPGAKAKAMLKGRPEVQYDLTFVRVEPYVVPKKSLTGDNTERVDTRVLQVIYSVDPTKERLYVGQQLDVFIATADDVATAQ